MKYRYMAVEREYGCGGEEVARTLARQLDIPCYGKEILDLTSQRCGLSVDTIQHYEETVSNSLLFSVYLMSNTFSAPDLLNEGSDIYRVEQAVIRELAAKGPAIFLGHSAAEALRDHRGVAKVFLRADAAEKRARIIGEYAIPEKQAEATRRRFDKKRANYYHANTGLRWDDLRNYDMVLDRGTLGLEACVDALMGLMK